MASKPPPKLKKPITVQINKKKTITIIRVATYDTTDPTRPTVFQTDDGRWRRRVDLGTGCLPPAPPYAQMDVTPANTLRNVPTCNVKKDGKSTSGNGPCQQPAGWGTTHKGLGPCKLHGGCLPEVTQKYLTKQAREELATYGAPKEVDPHTAALQLVHLAAGHVAWLYDKIQALADPDDPESIGEDATLHQYTSMGIKASVWIDMYHREREQLLKACKAAVEMGVSERQVQLAEEQGRLIAMILQQFIDNQDLALTPAQRQTAPKVIRRLLNSIPAASVMKPLPTTT